MKKNQKKRPRRFIAAPGDHTKKRKEWASWIKTLESDFDEMSHRHEMFLDLIEIARSNSKIGSPGYFLDAIIFNHAFVITVWIRKFVDTSKSSSLWMMLFEILERPGALSRSDFLAIFQKEYRASAEGFFDEYAGLRCRKLSQTKIRSDLAALEKATDRMRKVANKMLVHFGDGGKVKKKPTWNEIKNALNVIEKLISKYKFLLTADGSPIRSTPQADWAQVLLVPWVGPENPRHPDYNG